MFSHFTIFISVAFTLSNVNWNVRKPFYSNLYFYWLENLLWDGLKRKSCFLYNLWGYQRELFVSFLSSTTSFFDLPLPIWPSGSFIHRFKALTQNAFVKEYLTSFKMCSPPVPMEVTWIVERAVLVYPVPLMFLLCIKCIIFSVVDCS